MPPGGNKFEGEGPHSDQMSEISGQLLISGQFQDICDISGISGQLGALHILTVHTQNHHQHHNMHSSSSTGCQSI